jgi:hypothetical protein
MRSRRTPDLHSQEIPCHPLPRPPPKPVLLPQPIPLPNPRILRQPITQLMRQHQDLPSMMRFMRKHVSERRPTRRPRPRPTATPEFHHAPLLSARQSIRKHPYTLRRALPVRRRGLSNSAPRRIQRRRTLQMRRRTLQPNQPAVMQVRKDRSNRPPAESASGQLRPPSPRIKMRQQPLIHGIVDRICLDQHRRKISRRIRADTGRTRPRSPRHKISSTPGPGGTVDSSPPLRVAGNPPVTILCAVGTTEHFK